MALLPNISTNPGSLWLTTRARMASLTPAAPRSQVTVSVGRRAYAPKICRACYPGIENGAPRRRKRCLRSGTRFPAAAFECLESARWREAPQSESAEGKSIEQKYGTNQISRNFHEINSLANPPRQPPTEPGAQATGLPTRLSAAQAGRPTKASRKAATVAKPGVKANSEPTRSSSPHNGTNPIPPNSIT